MNVNLSFLANPVFGWMFVWIEIISLYAAFLVFHRIVEQRRKRQK